MSGWDGWFLVARSEHTGGRDLFPAGDPLDLPSHVRLERSGRVAVEATLRQTADDAGSDAPVSSLDALLLHELRGLLVRLQLVDDRGAEAAGRSVIDPVVRQRFRSFRALVEREHGHWHSVGRYARELGCSPRTLSRASEAVSGSTAKAFITRRIVLEAERLLAHTSDPVAAVGTHLGFDEPTNFVKWFRRETGVTPGAFRSRHSG
jgi:AraC-like DNA-binding protein